MTDVSRLLESRRSRLGRWAGAADPRDSTVALGFAGAMSDLPAVTNRGGTLYVFALP